jgi:hypothetical protein
MVNENTNDGRMNELIDSFSYTAYSITLTLTLYTFNLEKKLSNPSYCNGNVRTSLSMMMIINSNNHHHHHQQINLT